MTDLPAFNSRIVPVVVIQEPAQALPLARALLDGGIDVIEVTLRSAAALLAIEAIAHELPQMAVGAGSVSRPEHLAQVRDAGARFALSPGATPALLSAAACGDLPFVPGVATPSEAMAARDAGFTLVKFFPAHALGGVETLRAWSAPLPELRYCPTGGVTPAHLSSYFALPQVALVGGSWLTPGPSLQTGDWARIRQIARAASRALPRPAGAVAPPSFSASDVTLRVPAPPG